MTRRGRGQIHVRRAEGAEDAMPRVQRDMIKTPRENEETATSYMLEGERERERVSERERVCVCLRLCVLSVCCLPCSSWLFAVPALIARYYQ